MRSVVIIEHEHALRDSLISTFESHGYTVWACVSPELASSLFLTVRPDLVLVDLDLDENRALRTIESWKIAFPDITIIAQSEQTDDIFMKLARENGASDYWVKPYDLEAIWKGLPTAA